MRPAERSGSSRDSDADAACRAYSKRGRAESTQRTSNAGGTPEPKGAAPDLGVFALTDVLALWRTGVIAELHGAILDVEGGSLAASLGALVLIFVVTGIPFGAADCSDGVGRVHFKCRRATAHRAHDYGVQMAAEQADLAWRTDSVDEDAAVDCKSRRCAQLQGAVVDQTDGQRRVHIGGNLIVQQNGHIRSGGEGRAIALDIRRPLNLRDRADRA